MRGGRCADEVQKAPMLMNSPILAASSPSETCLRQVCERARGRRGEEACPISRGFRRPPLALQAALASGHVSVEQFDAWVVPATMTGESLNAIDK